MFRVSTKELAKEPVGATLSFHFAGRPLDAENTLLTADGTVTKLKRGFLVHLDARWRSAAECDRCLDPVEWVQSATVEEEFGPEATDDVRPIEEGVLDLWPTIEEMLVLERPVKVLCHEDCAGLCPYCGCNRNHESCTCSDERIDPRLEALRHWKGDR